MSPFFINLSFSVLKNCSLTEKIFYYYKEKKLCNHSPIKKKQFLSIFFIYLFIPLNPLIAFEARDYLLIDRLVNSCYEETEFCNAALFEISNYQKNAAINKKFSCQTRLLGLEANLIMAMNSNLKKKEAKSIKQSLKKHC